MVRRESKQKLRIGELYQNKWEWMLRKEKNTQHVHCRVVKLVLGWSGERNVGEPR